MVQIPTAADIQRASANSGRVAPQASGGYAGQALSNLGKSIVSVAFDLNDLATQERADQINSRSNDVSTAMQRFIADEDQRYNEARDKASASGIGFTREYLTGYQQRANDFAKANFEGLSPDQQTSYLNNLLATGNQFYAKANSFEGARKKDFYDLNTNTSLDGIRTRIRSNAAPFEDLKKQGLEAINSAPMDEAWKNERRKAWESDAAESKVQWDFERDPVGTIDKLKTPTGGGSSNVVDKIIGAESSGDANAQNPNSSAGGLGQFIDSTWLATVRQHRPDVAAGKSAAQILAMKKDTSPDGRKFQREMLHALTDDNAAFLSNEGIQATDGNVYLAHFLGSRGAVQVLKSDPSASVEGIVGRDVVRANPFLRGKSVSDLVAWANKKMGGTGKAANYDPAYDGLSYDRRETLLRQSETQYGTASRVAISNASDNAFTAIQNTGVYTGQLPSRDQFNAAFGAQGGQKYDEFQQAIQTSQQIYAMRLMPADQIKGVLDGARPQSSGDTASADQKTYDTLTKAADATLKARASDPAGYVQQTFPQVRSAFQDAQDAAGTDGQASAYRNAINVSMAAQRQLGVSNPQPLPQALVKAPVDTFKDETLPADQRTAAVAQVLNATNDPRQKQALFNQMVKEGLPDITEGALNAMARGDTGAANRLFEAAMIDPSKLPGKSPEKPDDIRSQIQSDVMDAGQIGDIYYGLSDGSTDNLMAAQRDAKLLSNAVEIRVRKGESLGDAISGAAKDLYGDVKPVEGDSRVNAHVLIPSDQDEGFVLDGLHSVLPDVKSALETAMPIPAGAKASDGSLAIATATRDNRIGDIMSNGYFRNMGDGYAFFDGYTGTAVRGSDGKPLIFHDEDFKAPEKPKAQLAPAWPGERAGNYVGSLVKPAPSAQKPAEQQMPAQPTPDQILSGQDSVFGAR